MPMRAAAALVLAALAWSAHALDVRARVDPLARPLIEGRRVVGFVVGVLKDGETQVLPYGEVEKGSGKPPAGDTVYEIGSITKTFTGILLAYAIARGEVQLEAPVQEYLPQAKVPSYEGKPLTLRGLITHTSGLPRLPDNFRPWDRENPYADYTLQQMYAFLDGHTLRRPAGKFEYSNFAMGLAGHVLALRANAGYPQLLAERICEPLGLRDTAPVSTPSMLERLAPPYDAHQSRTKSWDIPALAGAGGIRSTVNDLLVYARANLRPDGTPLGRAIALSHRKLETHEDGRGHAMGWGVSKSGKVLWHGGSTGGYRAWLSLVPERNTAVVVLSNTYHAPIPQLGDRLTYLLAYGEKARPPARADDE